MASQAIILTGITTTAEISALRLLVESIRIFSGPFSGCPIWVFCTDPHIASCRDFKQPSVEFIPMTVPEAVRRYPFGSKVFACARAEQMTTGEVTSLVWLDPECLIVRPPLLYDLGDQYDAAFRPVHHRNIGLKGDDKPDAYWERIYRALGVPDVALSVKSFIGEEPLRAYFNTHGFSIDPRLGILRRWLEFFSLLAADANFQETACKDEIRQIFLFQAVLSTMIATEIERGRLRILPPSYNYPYNLHEHVPEGKRVTSLNDLVSFTYEGRPIHPDVVTDIEIHGALRVWLRSRAGR